MKNLCSLFLLIQFLIGLAEKRILLNDPDVILSQIHDLERKYQDILVKYSDLSTKYSDLSSNCSHTSTKYSDLTTKYSDMSTNYSDLTTKYSEMSTKYSDLTTKYSDMSTKYSDLVAKTSDLTMKYDTLLPRSTVSGVFVRWGRKDCPADNETELVYSGFGGGSWYDNTGAAAEFVCLPRDPNLTTNFTSSGAFMYGAEYDTTDFGHKNGDDLPCVVCRRKTQSSVLMIPGKNSCYSGWTEQYHGYLAAGYYNSPAATQYICLDEHPDVLTAGERNDDGKLLVPVQAVCGALACPPYHNNMYLTCAVCTK